MHRKNALVSLLSLTVGAAVLAAPLPVRAAPGHVPAAAFVAAALANAATAAEASVLGIKGGDADAADGLTASLRKAFATRGMSGGDDLSLDEVMLTMGCETKEDATCMTEAGKALNVERLIYGELTPAGSGYTLDIVVLDTAQGMIEAQASTPLTADDLSAANVELTAAEVVNSLYPGNDDEGISPPPPVAEPADDIVIEDDAPPPRDSDYIWGKYSPRPRWKKVGLGVSAGVAVAGLLGGVTTAVMLPNIASKVKTLATSSVNDDNPANDIPDTVSDFCVAAEAPSTLPSAEPGDVTNAAVAEECAKGDVVRTINVVSFAVMGVGIAATIAFTVLYFVHKKPGAATQARQRRFQLSAGGDPRGFVLGGTGHF